MRGANGLRGFVAYAVVRWSGDVVVRVIGISVGGVRYVSAYLRSTRSCVRRMWMWMRCRCRCRCKHGWLVGWLARKSFLPFMM